MDELKKMIMAIANGQSAFRAEIRKRFEKVDERFDTLENKLTKRIDDVETNLSNRMDKIGLQVARLEDDAPTRDEHDLLVKRVTKIEKRVASA